MKTLKNNWLWDRNMPVRQALEILDNPQHSGFCALSALLLSRKNDPQDVFRNYLKPREFCRYWLQIKRLMRRDNWNDPRIEFWQAIYEKLLEKFHEKGINASSRSSINSVKAAACIDIGQKLKGLRRQKKLTQKVLAKKLRISQQMISRIESGRENISLLTLKKIAQELGVTVRIDFAS